MTLQNVRFKPKNQRNLEINKLTLNIRSEINRDVRQI